jgi:hypothetical protein
MKVRVLLQRAFFARDSGFCFCSNPLRRLRLVPCPFDQLAGLRPVPSSRGQVAVDKNRIDRIE